MSVSLDMPNFYPDALEAGTLSFPAIVSLLEGSRFVQKNLEKIGAHCQELTKYFLDGLSAMREYRAYSKPNPCGIVAFSMVNMQFLPVIFVCSKNLMAHL